MSNQYSDPVDAELFATWFPTRLQVRKSKYSSLALDMLEQFAQGWKDAGGPRAHGGRAPMGHGLAFGIPNARPETISVFVRLSEFVLMVDDVVDGDTNQSARPLPPPYDPLSARPRLAPHSFNPLLRSYERTSTQQRSRAPEWPIAQKQILSKIILDILTIDSVRANILIEAVDQWQESFSSHDPTLGANEGWDEWLARRWEDGFCYIALIAIIFACGLDLTPKDLDPVWSIAWKGMAVTVLVNDIYSFDKESVLQLTPEGLPMSGVWRLMQERNITTQDAKEVLYTEHIVPLETQFIEEKARFIRDHEEDCPELISYLQQVEYMVAGTWYWSSRCYRYHEWRETLVGFKDESWACYASRSSPDESTAMCETYLQLAADNARLRDACYHHSERESKHASVPPESTSPSRSLDDRHLAGPIKYLEALPSKNVRGLLIETVGSWFKIPPATLDRIESIICDLHNTSLLLDDIQDQSPLRRGKPAPHRIFGTAQTINSATFLYVRAVREVIQLTKHTQEIFLEELETLEIGQSYDIHWARTCSCPSIDEYMEMVKMKTGGLFSMLGRIIYAEAEKPKPFGLDDLISFLLLLGQLFQIRDDFVNLTSAEYEKDKGFAEDLDEGKYSLPLIHVLEHSPDRPIIEEILLQRSREGKMAKEVKKLVLEKMREVKSLDFVKGKIDSLETKSRIALAVLEKQSGVNNYMLQYFITRLVNV
ncbi:isoprenoid synthase domain-containing protein [Aspergillus pseudoustus]|uniref:Isoprenoid synthase domain-containing protein n=1 Tax=Aspergillus pseudoustus TaxID=1810923 RepID=A0ABR4JSE2_9EURO